MDADTNISRRDFLQISSAALAGLVVGFYIPGYQQEDQSGEGAFEPNAFIRIDTNGEVSIYIPKPEIGQGIKTALAMAAAEELDVIWSRIHIEQAVADGSYGDQVTGGSLGMIHAYMPLRRAGAEARARLVAAAAQTWNVEPDTCFTRNGMVVHRPSNRTLSYGELAPRAAEIPGLTSSEIVLKKPDEFRIIGRSMGAVDEPDIVKGSAIYGLDVKIPGMLYTTLAMPPVLNSTVREIDDSQTLTIPGVHRVVQVRNDVAVLADSTWAAIQGRRALKITWDEGQTQDQNSERDRQAFVKRMQEQVLQNDDPNVLTAIYEVPLLAHAAMEPMNCVANVETSKCEVWAPTQDPIRSKRTAASITGLPQSAVTVHVPLIGGGFGRRLEQDYVAQAVRISQEARAPVKLFWTREDDFQHDYYHPMSVHVASGRIDNPGMPTVESTELSTYTRYGFWRSVENFTNAFVRECFLDELAVASGRDPFELRLELEPEFLGPVLEEAASKGNWGAPLPDGWGRGIACHATWNATPVAQVAEVSVSRDGTVRVHRVVCAIDCGMAINPNMIAAQMEGGIAWGLTAVLKRGITVVNSRVQQSNFHDYPLLRMDEMPVVEVHIMPSEERPRGVGEMAVPPLAPAVLNAVFAATGKRLRRLPIRSEDLMS